jgi:hypothetical protein
MIGWYGQPFRERLAGQIVSGEFVIKTVDGKTVSSSRAPAMEFFPATSSESSRRLAFTGR